MGISGLLPLLRSITRRVHLSQFAGQTVAVDAYSWLHKGIYGSCAVDLFHGRPNDSYVDFCMAKVRLLLHYNVRPIMVFDGARLPMKTHQETLRSQLRKSSRAKADELLAKGDASAAYLHIQKAVDVTPQMAARLIQELHKHGIEFVVAPFEADAQMAWLDRTGKVAAVVTEDSDLLLFGCKRVLFKLDKDGFTDEICLSRLVEATELDFGAFSLAKFRHMCMLSGCDYLPSIHGMGLKTAYKYICRYPDINRVLQVMRAEMPAKMPPGYEADFAKAELTFLHQRVFDTELKRIVHLNPLPLDFTLADDERVRQEWTFLGPLHQDDLARSICEGRICPNTLVPFRAPLPIHIPQAPLVEISSSESPSPSPSPSPLPFTLTIERQPEAPHSRLSTSPHPRSAISAARISLKRMYSADTRSQKENIRPVPRSFAFGSSSRSLLLKGIPSYHLPPPRSGKLSSSPASATKDMASPLDTNQRSIRDFFRPVNK